MILKKDILVDGNPLLRKKAEEVTLPLSDEDQKILDLMIEYIDCSQDEVLAAKYDIVPGVGLAAPQLGILKKMFVVKAVDENGKLHHYALVNPKLLSHSVVNSYLSGGEGCLSVPEVHPGYVKRHYKIKMKAYDYISKKEIVLSLKGYVAIVVQHEYDHLFGILYFDKINSKAPFEPIENAIEI